MEELRNLISKVNESEKKDDFFKAYYYLMEERVKIVKNDLINYLGIEEKNIDKAEILRNAKIIDSIAEELNSSFRMGSTYEEIEKKLRLTILEDISIDFEKQKNN